MDINGPASLGLCQISTHTPELWNRTMMRGSYIGEGYLRPSRISNAVRNILRIRPFPDIPVIYHEWPPLGKR